jgi:hypothetical protein
LPCVLFLAHGKVFLKKRRFIFLENGRGEKYFAVRREENARQTISLPCVLFPAHGKELVYRAFFFCRVPYKRRTANKLFAVHPKLNARQRF